ncbi:MAG TPA: thioredoxin domain-containing protein [Glaciihabitans sp.]|nr:thioredoxin domain-containing protein [Glaciihabitans sp.]
MSSVVGRGVTLDFYSSAFCDPCIMTRAVLAEVATLVPAATITELDVARDEDRARDADIRSTPTVVVRAANGDEVFRAEGVPSLNQVLVALAKAV